MKCDKNILRQKLERCTKNGVKSKGQRTRFNNIFVFLRFFDTFYLLTPPRISNVLKNFPAIPPIVSNIISDTKGDSFISRYTTLIQRLIFSKIAVNFTTWFCHFSGFEYSFCTTLRWSQRRRLFLFAQTRLSCTLKIPIYCPDSSLIKYKTGSK